MSPTAYKPPGWPTVVPRIFVSDVEGLVAFMKDVFGAAATVRPGAPTEVSLDGSILIVSDGQGVREPTPVFLYVYVSDVDAVFERAIKAGSVLVEPPADMPYGDRRATVRDRWGDHWQIATRFSSP